MNIVLILSGGTGSRLGADIPKQYIEINGKPIIAYSTAAFAEHNGVDAIVIVAAREWHDYIHENVKTDKFRAFSEPGENRQMSIYNGLCTISGFAAEDDIVIVHDAARPLVSKKIIDDCLEAAKDHDGALPVLPMKDTVYLSENGKTVTTLLQREKIFAGQAPEAFKFGKYLAANEKLLPDRIMQINGSTEPAVLAGMDIALISGDEMNFKITTPNDLARFEEIMRNKA